jgi:hypothetical protein
MISIAITRVLSSPMDRAAIGSLADLRRMYQDELAANGHAIATQADVREVLAGAPGLVLRSIGCDLPMSEAKRRNRRYCSDRCRQYARRPRLRAAAGEA